jgi:hypothetical protein
MMSALLLATALATGAGGDSVAAPSAEGQERWFRVVANAGPTLVSHEGAQETALGFGTGFELGTNPWFRFIGRWEVHVSRAGPLADQTTVMLFGVKLQYRAPGQPVWPYCFVASGYGTAPSYSDFYLPAAAEMGFGGQVELPGGQELFLEVAVLGANECTFTPIRFGVLLP